MATASPYSRTRHAGEFLAGRGTSAGAVSQLTRETVRSRDLTIIKWIRYEA